VRVSHQEGARTTTTSAGERRRAERAGSRLSSDWMETTPVRSSWLPIPNPGRTSDPAAYPDRRGTAALLAYRQNFVCLCGNPLHESPLKAYQQGIVGEVKKRRLV